jgi:hypothetical protein
VLLIVLHRRNKRGVFFIQFSINELLCSGDFCISIAMKVENELTEVFKILF